MLASANRNQQCMCQVELPGRLLLRCKEALANENHALHQPLQRTFERLSCQALTPADFRYPINAHHIIHVIQSISKILTIYN